MQKIFFRGRIFGSELPLEISQLEGLTEMIDSQNAQRPKALETTNLKILSGRATAATGSLDGFGSIFIKSYARGGVVGKVFLRDRHLGARLSRSQLEFQMLKDVRELNVNAPRPLVWIAERKVLYRAWLVLEELVKTESIISVAERSLDNLETVMQEATRQIRILIRNRIKHVDLHPGNILIDQDQKVLLIDFDKALTVKDSQDKLVDFYIRRWRRAVIKHRLPPILTELMALGLRLDEI